MPDELDSIGEKISGAINEIEMEKAGIEGLDYAIGGLPSKSVILLVGEPGCSNTTFAQQILWNHAESGGKATYYLVGSTGLAVRQDMATFGWQLDRVIKAKSWGFVNLFTPEMSELLVNLSLPDQEKVDVEHNLNALKKDFLPRAQQGHWTVMDSLTFLLLEYSPKEIFSLVRYLTAAAHLYGGIHFIVCYEGVHEENVLNTLKLLADGVIEFALKEDSHEFKGSLSIRKMRKSLKTKIIPFTLSERGIDVETSVRIG